MCTIGPGAGGCASSSSSNGRVFQSLSLFGKNVAEAPAVGTLNCCFFWDPFGWSLVVQPSPFQLKLWLAPEGRPYCAPPPHHVYYAVMIWHTPDYLPIEKSGSWGICPTRGSWEAQGEATVACSFSSIPISWTHLMLKCPFLPLFLRYYTNCSADMALHCNTPKLAGSGQQNVVFQGNF